MGAWQMAGDHERVYDEARMDRWNSPEGGMTPRDAFMEEHGLDESDIAEERR